MYCQMFGPNLNYLDVIVATMSILCCKTNKDTINADVLHCECTFYNGVRSPPPFFFLDPFPIPEFGSANTD